MWSSDNAIFNVNGSSLERLTNTLALALGTRSVDGYKFVRSKGLVLYGFISSSNPDAIKFPTPLHYSDVAPLVWKWLHGDEAKQMSFNGWDADADHDGSNELGWRVYTEDWGHVEGEWHALAIRPAYVWYGK